jgi:predicted transcriptional regulator
MNIISASEKRTQLLMFLRGGSRTWREIKDSLSVSSQVMGPQVRILVDEGLITIRDQRYDLTDYGHAVLLHLAPALEALPVIEEPLEYWKTHLLRVIPDPLLLRIAELAGCRVITAMNGSVYEPRLVPVVEVASEIRAIASVINPLYPDAFLAAAERGVPCSIIVGPHVHERLLALYPKILARFTSLPNAELYVSKTDLKIGLAVTDRELNMTLFYSSGDVDPARDIIGLSPEALKWGRDLFEWYRTQSLKK